MPRGQADPGREHRLGATVIHDSADDLLHRLADELRCAGADRSRYPVGAAAVARPEARGFGRGRMVEGPDVLRQRPPCAPRPAVDAGGDDGGVRGHDSRFTAWSGILPAGSGHGLPGLSGLDLAGPDLPGLGILAEYPVARERKFTVLTRLNS